MTSLVLRTHVIIVSFHCLLPFNAYNAMWIAYKKFYFHSVNKNMHSPYYNHGRSYAPLLNCGTWINPFVGRIFLHFKWSNSVLSRSEMRCLSSFKPSLSKVFHKYLYTWELIKIKVSIPTNSKSETLIFLVFRYCIEWLLKLISSIKGAAINEQENTFW